MFRIIPLNSTLTKTTQVLLPNGYGLEIAYQVVSNVKQLMLQGTLSISLTANTAVGFGNVQVPNFANYLIAVEFNTGNIIKIWYDSGAQDLRISSSGNIASGTGFKVVFMWL